MAEAYRQPCTSTSRASVNVARRPIVTMVPSARMGPLSLLLLGDGGIEDSPGGVDGEAHRRVAGFGAVLVGAHGAAEAGVLAQGDEGCGQVLPS